MTTKTNLQRLEECEKRIDDLTAMLARFTELARLKQNTIDVLQPLAEWAIREIMIEQAEKIEYEKLFRHAVNDRSVPKPKTVLTHPSQDKVN